METEHLRLIELDGIITYPIEDAQNLRTQYLEEVSPLKAQK